MDEPLAWVDAFRRRHGRAPRILHIGNIANNAYLNAKFLNARGFDCDVICHDYRHIMACPEWEDAEFRVEGLDHYAPDWVAAASRGFERPRWFVQGPQVLCLDYLIARRTGKPLRARRLWRELSYVNGTSRPRDTRIPDKLLITGAALRRAAGRIASPISRAGRHVALLVTVAARHPQALDKTSSFLLRRAGPEGSAGYWFMRSAVVPCARAGVRLLQAVTPPDPAMAEQAQKPEPPAAPDRANEMITVAVARFAEVFPERADPLTTQDCATYHDVIERWAELFRHYDVVQAYATTVAFPLLAGLREYVAFEHGTLRDFSIHDSPVARLTALGFQAATHSLITNGDCLDYARRIKVRSAVPMIHPIDEVRIAQLRGDPEGLRRKHGARHLFLCPLRHEWAVKGTDHYIRALPRIAEMLGRDCRLLMTKWGSQLAQSVELARELGVLDLIAWIEPLSRAEMVRLQKSVDVIFDQIALPHFGATAPQAIATGTPVIMSYDPAFTEWIIPEPAPILAAWNAEEVVQAVRQALDPAWRQDYVRRAREWYDTHHSSQVVVRTLARCYRDILEPTN